MMSPRCRIGRWSAVVTAVALGGCTEAAPKAVSHFPSQPNRVVPTYLADSIYQYTDMTGTEPAPISGYGLVANLRGTGGCQAPTPVRDYVTKLLAQHQMTSGSGGYLSSDKILGSKAYSIVRVEGFIPPGARAGGDWCTSFDVRCTALPQSEATSLAHGTLYACDLKVGGANPSDPGNGKVEVKGQATGALFVNPKYVLDPDTDTPAARASRRAGVVLAGGRVIEDRPLVLQLRAPERRLARAIERRVIERFQDEADDDLQPHGNTAAKKVANADNEAVVNVFVPRAYADHWEHFAGVVRALYLRGGDPAFAAIKARELAEAADHDPKSALQEISYAWEGLGKPALFALQPLMTDARPDVRFAATRAAAFIGDRAAVPVLIDIASTPNDPFRVNAVQALGELPPTARIDALCRRLLDSDQATVRIAAYQLLARHGDPSIFTKWIKEGDREIFALDVVRTPPVAGGGPPPLIFATQRGIPRVAVFGTDTALDLPTVFATLEENRLIFASTPDGDHVNVSYRSPYSKDLVSFTSGPDLPELVALMAGDGNLGPSGTRLHLGYGDVVAVLQSLADHQRVSGPVGDHRLAATFVLGEASLTSRVPVDTSTLLRPDAGRPVNRGAASRPADVTPADADSPLRHNDPPTNR